MVIAPGTLAAIAREMSFRFVWLAALAACSGSSSSAPADAAGPDVSVDAPDAGEAPITAPADTWTWVPIAGTKCLHGTETGIGVNLHPGATRLVVFLQGGGSCTHCWGASESARVGTPTHYDATTLAAEPDIGNANGHGELVLQRVDVNPLADANFVFVPYCTGDYHGGSTTRSEIGDDGLSHDDAFWGATDLDLILRRLIPTFPNPSRVWLAGTSAGGVGTNVAYPRVRAAFGVRTDVIDDSGVPMTPSTAMAPSLAQASELWGITPFAGCPTCATLLDIFHYDRSLDSTSRYAVLSNAYDAVQAEGSFGTPSDNPQYLDDFRAGLQSFVTGLDANGHGLVVRNTIDAPAHVVMNKVSNAVDIGAWLQLMVDDDPTWSDTTIAP